MKVSLNFIGVLILLVGFVGGYAYGYKKSFDETFILGYESGAKAMFEYIEGQKSSLGMHL